MRIPLETCCDVLVIGAGIAGVSAAITAAEHGCSVILTCSTHIFSGSSFYPGTWGLGLIGPTDTADREDLKNTILRVGCGMADPALVHSFVDGIHPAIERVRNMGIKLRRADRAGDLEYIPCFDHKHRDWNGIEFESARKIFSKQMDRLGIVQRPHCEALELVQSEGRICGAVFCERDHLKYIGCRALVLASGGYGGIFKYHLNTEDVTGMGQYLALKAGCRLVNVEFMQMMPGYICPAPKTIFNEKTFRYTELKKADGTPLLEGKNGVQHLMEIRSTHGPFTSRLPSREIDLALFHSFLADERGITASYTESMKQNPPEFIKTYFDWLKQTRNLDMDTPVQLGIFAHAANGGIQIDPDSSTGVSGLFACGEVTGGMHGADRIGGLSTANGLVFGGKAGYSAATACQGTPDPVAEYELETFCIPKSLEILAELREIMFRSAMLSRTETQLRLAQGRINELIGEGKEYIPAKSAADVATGYRLMAQLHTASAIISAALLRRESRGAHYREDFPSQDPQMARPIIVDFKGEIRSYFKE